MLIWVGIEFASSVKQVWVSYSALNLRVVYNLFDSMHTKFPVRVIQISVASKNGILEDFFIRLNIIVHECLNLVVLDKFLAHADLNIFVYWELQVKIGLRLSQHFVFALSYHWLNGLRQVGPF